MTRYLNSSLAAIWPLTFVVVVPWLELPMHRTTQGTSMPRPSAALHGQERHACGAPPWQPRTQATPEGSPAPSGELEAPTEKWMAPQARAPEIGAGMGRDTIPQWCVWMSLGPDADMGLAVWGWSVLAGVSVCLSVWPSACPSAGDLAVSVCPD